MAVIIRPPLAGVVRDSSWPLPAVAPGGVRGCRRVGRHQGGGANEPSDWRARHAEFIADSQNGGYDVLCLGDSLTRGWDDHRDVWAERVTGKRTAFHAIGGETTNGLLWRLEHGETDALDPKLVVVLIGTNNRGVKDDPDDIAGGVAAVIGRIRERLPRTQILVLGLLPQGRTPHGASRRLFAEVNLRLQAFDGGSGASRRG
jgi:lysophospholipase L1-like esterase